MNIIIKPGCKPMYDQEQDIIYVPTKDNTTIQHEIAHSRIAGRFDKFGNPFEELLCCYYAVMYGKGITKGFWINLFGIAAYTFIISSIVCLLISIGMVI